jgi:uncharacterized repeat protein (TIGR04138 family)
MNEAEVLRQIIDQDKRYKIEAYLFVLESLFYTRSIFSKEGHVTGQELLEGIKRLGIERFGPLAKMVFEHWGITETVDFGNIVFNLVNSKILGKTEEDRIDDFKDIYDFDDVFVARYKPTFGRFKAGT